MPWDDPAILSFSEGRFELTERFRTFLKTRGRDFDYFFLSVQPRTFDMLWNESRALEFIGVFDQVLEILPLRDRMALHHTFLNLGTFETNYPRERIAEFTNILIRHYGIKWVNEDLGVWSLKGKMLPYPLPPVLNDEGLKHSVTNIEYFMKTLSCPLFVEFPGFSEGASFHIGRANAFEFFNEVIRRTGAAAVIDTGHILSYQWLKGRRSHDFLEGLDEVLPFESCREIHLSGCSVVKDKFVDFHHGVLMDEQLVLLDYLLDRCPNVIGVTYEDPKFDAQGALIPKSIRNYERLKDRVRKWKDDEPVHGMDLQAFA